MLYVSTGTLGRIDVNRKATYYCPGQSSILAFFSAGMMLIIFILLHNRSSVYASDRMSC